MPKYDLKQTMLGRKISFNLVRYRNEYYTILILPKNAARQTKSGHGES